MSAAPLPSVRRLMQLAQETASEDPVAAYLCAWAAFDHVVGVLANRAGVRAQFALRRNGTLRNHTVGDVRMPEIIPPRPEHERAVALSSLTPEARSRLIHHPTTAALSRRVPRLNGRPIAYDSHKQRLTGVLDVAATLDPRYPVWASIDAAVLGELLGGAQDDAACEALVGQIVAVLATIQRNLRRMTNASEGEANVELARSALPLLVLLVETLTDGG